MGFSSIPLPRPESAQDSALETFGNINSLAMNYVNQIAHLKQMQEQAKQNALIQDRQSQLFPYQLAEAKTKNELLKPQLQADIANKEANTNKLKFMQDNPFYGLPGAAGQLGAYELAVKNPKLLSDPKNLDYLKNSLLNSAQPNLRNLGTGGSEELFFQSLVSKDNPQLKTPEQIYQASNVLRNGGNSLPDGTKLNNLSPASRQSLDRLIKGTTTSAAMTSLINANQADTEIGVLSDYAKRGLAEYGDTYFGYSPSQMLDTLKTDDMSQKKLGRLIASQQLQYDVVQQQIKLANGQSGVTSTQELIDLGKQNIKSIYPRLSKEARQEAQRYFTEALQEGLKARKRQGVSISQALNTNNSNENKNVPRGTSNQSNNVMTYNPSTGRLE